MNNTENDEYYLGVFQNSIFPKLLNLIENKQKQKNFKFLIESKLPSKSLGYKTEEEFLRDNNFQRIDIIQNSIKYSIKGIDDDVLYYLG